MEHALLRRTCLADPVSVTTFLYVLGLLASAIENGARWVPAYVATAAVAAFIVPTVGEHQWRRNRSRAGRSTTGSP